jgi:hypothetical protein
MVEPWNASGGWPSPGSPRPGTIQMPCTARPPSTQPKCSSPVIVAGCPPVSGPVHSRRQEPTKRPKSMSLSACSAAGPVTWSASISPVPRCAPSVLPVTGCVPRSARERAWFTVTRTTGPPGPPGKPAPDTGAAPRIAAPGQNRSHADHSIWKAVTDVQLCQSVPNSGSRTYLEHDSDHAIQHHGLTADRT